MKCWRVEYSGQAIAPCEFLEPQLRALGSIRPQDQEPEHADEQQHVQPLGLLGLFRDLLLQLQYLIGFGQRVDLALLVENLLVDHLVGQRPGGGVGQVTLVGNGIFLVVFERKIRIATCFCHLVEHFVSIDQGLGDFVPYALVDCALRILSGLRQVTAFQIRVREDGVDLGSQPRITRQLGFRIVGGQQGDRVGGAFLIDVQIRGERARSGSA